MKKLSLCILLTLAFISTYAQNASIVPIARGHHTGVFDASREAFLIYGGFIYDASSQRNVRRVGDVWAWDGKSWQQIANTDIHKIVAPLAFDEKRKRTLMFGGSDDSGKNDGKLRVLEGKGWRVLKDAPEMARGDASLVYDAKRDRLVLFGGVDDVGKFFGDTWEFDGANWKRVSTTGPSPRSAGAVAYDSARGVTVLYGGFYPGSALADTWEWNGKRWKPINGAESPGPRSWGIVAYDSKRKRTILFGGEDDKQFYADTWSWDGNTWTRLATTGPAARIQFVMGYDSARDRIVLFGGVGSPTKFLNDLWEFDGMQWAQKL